jgi:hypothetical protein
MWRDERASDVVGLVEDGDEVFLDIEYVKLIGVKWYCFYFTTFYILKYWLIILAENAIAYTQSLTYQSFIYSESTLYKIK